MRQAELLAWADKCEMIARDLADLCHALRREVADERAKPSRWPDPPAPPTMVTHDALIPPEPAHGCYESMDSPDSPDNHGEGT